MLLSNTSSTGSCSTETEHSDPYFGCAVASWDQPFGAPRRPNRHDNPPEAVSRPRDSGIKPALLDSMRRLVKDLPTGNLDLNLTDDLTPSPSTETPVKTEIAAGSFSDESEMLPDLLDPILFDMLSGSSESEEEDPTEDESTSIEEDPSEASDTESTYLGASYTWETSKELTWSPSRSEEEVTSKARSTCSEPMPEPPEEATQQNFKRKQPEVCPVYSIGSIGYSSTENPAWKKPKPEADQGEPSSRPPPE